MVSAAPNLWDMSGEAKQTRLDSFNPVRGGYNVNNYSELANQAREPGFDAQNHALNMYGNMAAGRGPSVAEAQLRMGQNQANAQAMALAGRARGGNSAGAMQQALAAQGGGNQMVNQQAAMLRAQEQQQAMAAYGAMASQMYNQGYNYDALAGSQALGWDQNSLGWYTGKGNMDLQRDNMRQNFNLTLANAGIGAAGAVLGGLGTMSDERAKTNIRPTMAKGGVKECNSSGYCNVGTGERHRKCAEGSVLRNGKCVPVPSVYSDEGAKTNVNNTSSSMNATEAIGALTPVSYEYKPGYGAPGQRVGVIAQDMEKTPAGAAIVNNTPYGKTLDVGGMASLALAAQAEELQRNKERDAKIAELEAMLQSGTPVATNRRVNVNRATNLVGPSAAMDGYWDRRLGDRGGIYG